MDPLNSFSLFQVSDLIEDIKKAHPLIFKYSSFRNTIGIQQKTQIGSKILIKVQSTI